MKLELKGRQKKSVIVEGNTVKIIKEGGIFASERIKTLPIRNIASVEVKKPGAMFTGFIQFAIAGGKTLDSSFKISGGTFDAAQDENSVVFADDTSYKIALKIKEYIENYTEEKGTSTTIQQSQADELRKFKSLLDDGIITAEEFEKKKKELFGL